MKKNVLLYILIVFLLIVNAFFLYNYMGKPVMGAKGPDDFIVKELKFDQDQMDKFNKLSATHHQKMKSYADQVKGLKDDLFTNISKASLNKQAVDSIINLIGNKEQQVEAEVFYNLRAIHDLCNDEQKQRFNEIVKNARHAGGNPNQMPPPPPKK